MLGIFIFRVLAPTSVICQCVRPKGSKSRTSSALQVSSRDEWQFFPFYFSDSEQSLALTGNARWDTKYRQETDTIRKPRPATPDHLLTARTIPDKIVTSHNFIVSELLFANYMTWRGFFVNICGYMFFGSLEEVIGVEAEEVEKRKKQRDRHRHRTTQKHVTSHQTQHTHLFFFLLSVVFLMVHDNLCVKIFIFVFVCVSVHVYIPWSWKWFE